MTRRQAHQIINVLMQNNRSKIWEGKHSTLDEVQVYFELVHELYIRPPCIFNMFKKCRSEQCRFSHSPLETTKPTKFICARLDRIYNSRKNIYDSFDRVSVEHNVMRGKLALDVEREKIIHTISEIEHNAKRQKIEQGEIEHNAKRQKIKQGEVEHNAKRQKIKQEIRDRPPPEYTPPEYIPLGYTLPDIPSPTIDYLPVRTLFEARRARQAKLA